MKKNIGKCYYWGPRVLGIAFALFLALFAFDSSGWGFLMHLLPSLIIGGATAIAWKWPKYGGIAFILLGIISIFFFNTYKEIATFFIITFPFLLIGFLFVTEEYMKKK